MVRPIRKGATEARNQLPSLLAAAEKGRASVITKHGRPIAAIVPINDFMTDRRQRPLLPLKGSGLGLWGVSSTRTLGQLRDEWKRLASSRDSKR
ncbi:MAG: type II toxin-antitoxin system Phd/YefM family antitoxin [Steroidobacteraceae bacterium]